MEPRIQYARSGDLYIAYEVIGDAPVDLLYVTNYDSTRRWITGRLNPWSLDG